MGFFKGLKVAIVHDWLTGMRGGEKVLLELVRLMPTADVFTLVWKPGSVSREIESRIRGVSFLQKLPRIQETYRYYLPLFPAAVRSFDLRSYDLILSSCHAVAKGARVPSDALHVCYLHTPMRYLWDSERDYFEFGKGRWWKHPALRLAAPRLRRFDLQTAVRVDWFLANSENVRGRVRRIYGREAQVIPPPVDTGFFSPTGSYAPSDYYLVVSPLEPYKRVDLAVDAFSGGKRRLLIAGKGTLDRELRARASAPVEFVGYVTDEKLRELYRHSRALIFPGREDFGIVPVEAQACGRPVVCFGAGGALETVADGITGVHFKSQTAAALMEAVERQERMLWDSHVIRQRSLYFSRRRFRIRLESFWRTHLRLSHDHAA
jgi:glycosyltransferase involved in cell wall biosynthesis